MVDFELTVEAFRKELLGRDAVELDILATAYVCITMYMLHLKMLDRIYHVPSERVMRMRQIDEVVNSFARAIKGLQPALHESWRYLMRLLKINGMKESAFILVTNAGSQDLFSSAEYRKVLAAFNHVFPDFEEASKARLCDHTYYPTLPSCEELLVLAQRSNQKPKPMDVDEDGRAIPDGGNQRITINIDGVVLGVRVQCATPVCAWGQSPTTRTRGRTRWSAATSRSRTTRTLVGRAVTSRGPQKKNPRVSSGTRVFCRPVFVISLTRGTAPPLVFMGGRAPLG